MNPAYRQALNEGEQWGVRFALAVPQEAVFGFSGSRLGRHTGSSLDFQDYREYQPGDDLRRIDWKVYARSDKLTVKLFREEVNPHLDLILDASRSMQLEGTGKAAALMRLAALFVTAAANARCTHETWISGQGIQRVPNGAERPGAWDGIALEGRHSLEQDYALVPPRLRRQGIRVLLSDLLWPGDPQTVLRRMSDQAAAVIVVQLLSTADLEPPNHGNLQLEDVETGQLQDVFVGPAEILQYQAALARHTGAWELACRQIRARLVRLVAEPLTTCESLKPLEAAQVLVAV